MNEYEYIQKNFPKEDELTQIKIRIAFLDGMTQKAKEITKHLKEENLEMQEPDYSAIKDQFEEDERIQEVKTAKEMYADYTGQDRKDA